MPDGSERKNQSMNNGNHSPSDSNVKKIEDLGPDIVAEARLDALIWALDRILPRVTSEHLFREECPCRWCCRQRDLRAGEAVTP